VFIVVRISRLQTMSCKYINEVLAIDSRDLRFLRLGDVKIVN